MAELRTEEEQIEAIKSWWKENGKSLLLSILVVVSAVVGWKSWQQYQVNQASQASALYQNLVDAVIQTVGNQADAGAVSTAEHLSERLKGDFTKTSYAQFAALLMARVAVEQGDLSRAQQELDWLLDGRAEGDILRVANLRKGRVLAELGLVDDAIALLQNADAGAFESGYQELLGDLYSMSGRVDQARAAYNRALEVSQTSQGQAILRMKRDDLGIEVDS
ncbi:YfgM family protein [Nitrincola alkalilacustris]|uniref:YfgM family protein n=1 Tax=Nitrincola alkalilacustris TaxID=1571224 RepID=UPI00124D45BE|nr:tetratricopeptide repeat protein [Nitrincola alkalilacustris]